MWLKSLPKKELRNVLHHSHADNNFLYWCRSTVVFINHSSHSPIITIDKVARVWKTIVDVDPGVELNVDYSVFGEKP